MYYIIGMAIRKILIFPDPILREKAKPIQKFDEKLASLVADMIETMHHFKGVGLAAPQIGEKLRVCVIHIPPTKEEEKKYPTEPIILINPEIIEKEGEIEWNEGCLSFPGIYEDIKRSEKIKVNAYDINEKPFTLEAEGLLSVAIQHEIDHLNGILIFDYMSYLKKKMVKREMKKKALEQSQETARNGAE